MGSGTGVVDIVVLCRSMVLDKLVELISVKTEGKIE